MPAAVPADEAIEEPRLVGKSALVVDDNATNRHILQETLDTWGIHSTLAESGSLALELIQKTDAAGTPFDLVVLDAQMPEMDGFELASRILERRGPSVPTVVMLSSADRTGDLARCRQLGVTAYLTKPVAPGDLRQVILEAFGQAARPKVSPVPPAPFGRPETTLTVLVADDNDANRVLASRILTKRGHRVTAVASGQEVLSALGRQAFDVVVLDVQMPGMDGFATAATIRESERATGLHVPIVAMTAYAMKGDRERCLEAGMDAYIAKPIRAREFWSLVESLGITIRTAARVASGGAMREGPFDFAPALARLEGDVELLKEQMQFVVNDAPGLVENVRSAISGRDHAALRLAAHRLKGLVGNFDATEACECATRLEEMGRSGDLVDAEGVCDELDWRVDELVQALARYVATH
jgi:CheY-like chemotaxis protein